MLNKYGFAAILSIERRERSIHLGMNALRA